MKVSATLAPGRQRSSRSRLRLWAGGSFTLSSSFFSGDTKPPVVSWRSHANLLYQNWLNYFVYQTTPYDLSAIRPV